MKVVRVMIAAAEELHQEMLEFTSLIEHLNKVLKPRGIELKRVKWIPEEEKSDFQDKLKDCEFCLKLYWTNFSNNSEKELKLAYDRLKQGDNPKNLYVFFKEPALDISDALKDFKANFVTNYGHFFCKFENVDTMNLHFILQFEDLQNRIDSNVLSIKEGNVLVGGEPIANLDNISFAALNKEYQRLKKELRDLDEQLAVLKKSFSENPADNDILSELAKVSTNRNKVSEEFEKHQNYLFNIAINFAKKSEQLYSERLARARELFEKGEVSEADRLLNLDLMKREAVAERSAFKLHQKNLEIKIEEFRTKAKTVMANGEIPLSDRFNMACEAYQEAISIANVMNNEEYRGQLNYSYGILLSRFNEKYQSIEPFEQSISSYRKLTKQDKDNYYRLFARSLNAYAEVQFDLKNYKDVLEACNESLGILEKSDFESTFYIGDALMMMGKIDTLQDSFRDAEETYNQSLQIYYELEAFKANICKANIAKLLLCIGELKLRGSRYQEALNCFVESLDILTLLSENNTEYLNDIIKVNLTMAKVYAKEGNINMAISTYDSCMGIIEQLTNSNPFVGLPLFAQAKSEKASVMEGFIEIDESESLLKESCRIYESLARTNKETFLPMLSETLYSLGVILKKQNKTEESITILKKCLYVYIKLSEWDFKKYYRFTIKTKRLIASVYSSLKKYDQSIHILEEIIKDNYTLLPLEEVSVLMELSSNQEKINQKKERIDTLNEIVQICLEEMPRHQYLKPFLDLAQNTLAELNTNNTKSGN
jgi:hypothetical protein